MGTACSECIFGTSDNANEPISAADENQHGSPSTIVHQAVLSLTDDILCGESVIPSFAWRYRRGFDTTPIGWRGARRIAELLHRHHNVLTLDLHAQQIGDEGIVELASLLCRDGKITSLNVSSNNVTAKGTSSFAKALIRNDSLTDLCFEGNPIQSAGVYEMASALALHPNINSVSLGSSIDNFQDTAAVALEQLLRHKSLRKLCIVGNGNGFSMKSLTSFLGGVGHSRIEILSFRSCVGFPHGNEALSFVQPMRALIKGMESGCCGLRSLELQIPLDDHAVAVLSDALPSLVSLRLFLLSHCSISWTGQMQMMEALERNNTLLHLDISSQGQPSSEAIVASFIDCAANALMRNTSLQQLNISDTSLTASSLEKLISALQQNRQSRLHVLRHGAARSEQLASALHDCLICNEEKMTKLSPKMRPMAKQDELEFVDIDF